MRDLEAMSAPPAAPFEACAQAPGQVNSQSLVRYETNDYSVPVAYGHRDVWVPVLPYGLFTSAANTVYAPGAFLRPTDLSPRLRSLIQRRAQQLYGDVCCLVPPPLAVKPCEDPDWAVDKFRWSAPVSGMERVADFLEFGRERIGELIKMRTLRHEQKTLAESRESTGC